MRAAFVRALLLCALGAAAATGCGGTSYVGTRSPDANLLAGQSAPDVRAAIVRALAANRSPAESEQAGRVVARLGKKDSYARVAIEYSESQYVIRYLDGTLTTKPGPGGDVLVDKRYATLTRRLKEGIDAELQRPARERAEAERNRREYELLLQQARTREAEANANAAAQAAQPAAEPAPAAAPQEGMTPAGVATALAPHIPVPSVQHKSTIRRSEQSLTCCINGALYNCPGQAAFQECMSTGPSKCTPAGRCR
jgi:hypothetical protein